MTCGALPRRTWLVSSSLCRIRHNGEYLVGFPGVQVFGMLPLGMQRIHRDDHALKVLDSLQQRLEVRDLVMLFGHVLLHEDGPGV